MGAGFDTRAVSEQESAVVLTLAATDSPMAATEEQVETTTAEASWISVDNQPVSGELSEVLYQDGTYYVALKAMSLALDPTAAVNGSNGHVTVATQHLTLNATVGKRYLEANGRYLYVPGGVKNINGVTLVPLRTLVEAFDGTLVWHPETGKIDVFTGSGGIESGEAFYDAEDLFWLSRIIYAESGNQPLEGKIAVGNVVMNRVKSNLFPNTIQGVIFDCRGGNYQFAPASKLEKRTPNAESVIAAKLTMEGAETVDGAMFFSTKNLKCWASRNRPYITTIGNHAFYG